MRRSVSKGLFFLYRDPPLVCRPRKNTAQILLDKTEAALLGDEQYRDLDVLEFAEYCYPDWTIAASSGGGADPGAS